MPDVWSYNQGTVLGALVTLGDAQSLARAAALVAAVDARLTTEVGGTRVLRTHGGGDGASSPGSSCATSRSPRTGPASTRRRGRPHGGSSRGTADALWTGRGSLPGRGSA